MTADPPIPPEPSSDEEATNTGRSATEPAEGADDTAAPDVGSPAG